MFAAIAPRYDLLNHVLSLNIDRHWRRLAVDQLDWKASPGGVYLDVCAGTFDLARELAARSEFSGRVVGADFVPGMLAIGRSKAPQVHPVGADALQLPFPTAQFDGCAVAFGIRNLEDVDAGLKEIARVLKPGRPIVILEFSTPNRWPIRLMYLFYFRQVLPMIGRLVSKHMTAYSYLPLSVARFPEGEQFLERVSRNGFRRVGWRSLTAGVAALYWGWVDEH